MEGIDALDWTEDKKPIEQIKAGVDVLQHAVWRNISYSLLDFKN